MGSGLPASNPPAPVDGPVRAALLALPLALTAVAYFPITRDFFFADDFHHFYSIRNFPAFQYIVAPQAEHLRLTSNSITYLQFLLFGPTPEPYFWMAFATHLLNTYLLLLAIEAFTHSPRLAALGAALWGVSPTNQGALGWYSVFGHVLVATFILLLLVELGRVANGRASTARTALAWALLLFAAATSFGVGIGMAMAFPVAAALVLPRAPGRARLLAVCAAVAVALPLLYLALFRIYPAPFVAPKTLDPLVQYFPAIVQMLGHLLAAGGASVIAGAAFDWSGYPGPFGYALAALLYVGVVLALVYGGATLRRRLLACLLLAVSAYAMVAMGRAREFAQGSLVPLRAIRYHYVGPAMLALLLCVLLAALARLPALRLSGRAKTALTLAGLAAIAAVHFRYGKPLDLHDRARRETALVLDTVNRAVAAAPPNGAVYVPNQVFNSMGPVFRRVPWIFPGWAGVFVVFFPDNVVDGKRVYFVDDRMGVRRKARDGRRTADLFVGTDDVPRAETPTP